MAATIVGCGDQSRRDPLLDSPLAIRDGEWNGDDALIEGRLEQRGNCLYIAPPVGGAGYAGGRAAFLVFARDGLDWDANAQAGRLGAAEFTVGQNVRFGGSVLSSAPSLSGVHWFKPPAAECDTSRVWFVGR